MKFPAFLQRYYKLQVYLILLNFYSRAFIDFQGEGAFQIIISSSNKNNFTSSFSVLKIWVAFLFNSIANASSTMMNSSEHSVHIFCPVLVVKTLFFHVKNDVELGLRHIYVNMYTYMYTYVYIHIRICNTYMCIHTCMYSIL